MKRHELIFGWKAVWSLQSLCWVLKESRFGWYDPMTGKNPVRKERAGRFGTTAKAAFDKSHRRYGSRQLAVEWIAQGSGPSHSTVVRSLRRQGLRARPRCRFAVTTDSAHMNPIAPKLLNRDFAPKGPNQVWAGDSSDIPTAEKWLYLAVLIDLWSRRIVGFAMFANIDKQLAMVAFHDAGGQSSLRAGSCTTWTGARSTPAKSTGRRWRTQER